MLFLGNQTIGSRRLLCSQFAAEAAPRCVCPSRLPAAAMAAAYRAALSDCRGSVEHVGLWIRKLFALSAWFFSIPLIFHHLLVFVCSGELQEVPCPVEAARGEDLQAGFGEGRDPHESAFVSGSHLKVTDSLVWERFMSSLCRKSQWALKTDSSASGKTKKSNPKNCVSNDLLYIILFWPIWSLCSCFGPGQKRMQGKHPSFPDDTPGSSLSGGPAASRGTTGPEVVLPVNWLLHFLVLKETGNGLSDGSAFWWL